MPVFIVNASPILRLNACYYNYTFINNNISNTLALFIQIFAQVREKYETFIDTKI